MATKRPAVKSRKALRPATRPAEPQSDRRLIWLPKQTGIRVTEDSGMTHSAVWGCVRFIAEGLAALSLHAYRKLPSGGREELTGNTVDWLLNEHANPETTAFIFRETITAHALTWGNGYAEIERDQAGRPAWLWQLTPDRVRPERATLDTLAQNPLLRRDGVLAGDIVYRVINPTGAPSYLPADNVIHFRGLGFDGLVGYSVMQMAARSVGAGLNAYESEANYFANDSTPGGVLEHPGKLSEAARNNLRVSWQQRHGGSRRTMAILEEGLKWHQTGLSPTDSKIIETLQFSITDVARWFRVPPHKIGDLTRSTNNNIEAQEIEAVVDCLQPWATRLEQECNFKLFGRTNRGVQFVAHNLRARLRGDQAAQTAHLTAMLDRGVYDVNEARDFMGMNPIGKAGDKRFIQANMQPLDGAGEPPPAPVVKPVPPAEKPPVGEKAPPPAKPPLSGWQMVLEDACERVARREALLVAEAKKRTVGVEWVEGFLAGHLNYLRSALEKVVLGFATELGVPGAASVVVEVCARQVGDGLRSALPHVLSNGAEWQPDGKAFALELFARVRAACAAGGEF